MSGSVIEELNKLAKNGRLTPRDVIDYARPDDSPLHEYFEWDDSIAADQYRLYQARKLIARVEVNYTTENIKFSVPGFVRDPDCAHDEQGYVAVAKVRSKKDVAKEIMLAELQRISSHIERAESLASYFDVQEGVKDVKKRVKRIEKRILEAA